MKAPLLPATLSLLALSLGALPAVEFETDILPIFEAKCSKCHMDGSSKGGVSLDLDRIGRDIGAGKAIVPGDADGSDLFEVVSLPEDDGDRMPPEGKGRPLSENELKTLKEWIMAGAPLSGEGEKMAEESAEEEKPASGLPERPEPLKGSWTNKDNVTIEATLLRVEGDKAVLQMENGKTYNYPIGDLSVESQAVVKKFMEGGSAAAES